MCVCLSVYFFCLFLLLVLLCVYPLNRWEKGTGNIASHSIKLITFAGGFIRKVSKKKEEFHFLSFSLPQLKLIGDIIIIITCHYLTLPCQVCQLVNKRERVPVYWSKRQRLTETAATKLAVIFSWPKLANRRNRDY